jgi:hypothetical protein
MSNEHIKTLLLKQHEANQNYATNEKVLKELKDQNNEIRTLREETKTLRQELSKLKPSTPVPVQPEWKAYAKERAAKAESRINRINGAAKVFNIESKLKAEGWELKQENDSPFYELTRKGVKYRLHEKNGSVQFYRRSGLLKAVDTLEKVKQYFKNIPQ